jgi:hypothetical protein
VRTEQVSSASRLGANDGAGAVVVAGAGAGCGESVIVLCWWPLRYPYPNLSMIGPDRPGNLVHTWGGGGVVNQGMRWGGMG